MLLSFSLVALAFIGLMVVVRFVLGLLGRIFVPRPRVVRRAWLATPSGRIRWNSN